MYVTSSPDPGGVIQGRELFFDVDAEGELIKMGPGELFKGELKKEIMRYT